MNQQPHVQKPDALPFTLWTQLPILKCQVASMLQSKRTRYQECFSRLQPRLPLNLHPFYAQPTANESSYRKLLVRVADAENGCRFKQKLARTHISSSAFCGSEGGECFRHSCGASPATSAAKPRLRGGGRIRHSAKYQRTCIRLRHSNAWLVRHGTSFTRV